MTDNAAQPLFFVDAGAFRTWLEANAGSAPELLVVYRKVTSGPAGYRKRILHWIASAKKDETRAVRLLKLIHASAAGIRLP